MANLTIPVPAGLDLQGDQIGLLVIPPGRLSLKREFEIIPMPAKDAKALKTAWTELQMGNEVRLSPDSRALRRLDARTLLGKAIEAGEITKEELQAKLVAVDTDVVEAARQLLGSKFPGDPGYKAPPAEEAAEEEAAPEEAGEK